MSKWEEWSNFVLKSIDCIEKTIKSIEKHINTINSKIVLLEMRGDRQDGSISDLKDEIKELQRIFGALREKIMINKIKIGIVFAGITIIFSGTITLLFNFILKKCNFY